MEEEADVSSSSTLALALLTAAVESTIVPWFLLGNVVVGVGLLLLLFIR